VVFALGMPHHSRATDVPALTSREEW